MTLEMKTSTNITKYFYFLLLWRFCTTKEYLIINVRIKTTSLIVLNYVNENKRSDIKRFGLRLRQDEDYKCSGSCSHIFTVGCKMPRFIYVQYLVQSFYFTVHFTQEELLT